VIAVLFVLCSTACIVCIGRAVFGDFEPEPDHADSDAGPDGDSASEER
jgi:hypothetical protein